jgi:hypothetical protein
VTEKGENRKELYNTIINYINNLISSLEFIDNTELLFKCYISKDNFVIFIELFLLVLIKSN